jgi:lipopolysaccharide transport system permease protein
LPEPLAWVLTINPFSHLVWCYQDALFFGAIEHPVSWFVLGGLSVTVFIAGFTVFEKLRVMFGEIL